MNRRFTPVTAPTGDPRGGTLSGPIGVPAGDGFKPVVQSLSMTKSSTAGLDDQQTFDQLECYNTPVEFNSQDNTIVQIDSYLMNRLTDRIKYLNVLYDRLRTEPEKEKESLRSMIRDIESGFEYLYYLSLREPIFEKYKSIQMNSGQSFISVSKQSSSELTELNKSYFYLIKPYVTVYTVFVKTTNVSCPNCNITMRHTNDQDGMYTCPDCFLETQIDLSDEPVFKDIDRINVSSKHVYTRIGHIKEAVQCYQGLQSIGKKKLDRIMNMIKVQCDCYKLSTDPLDPNCITKNDIYMFLDQEKMSDHYKDIHLIYRLVTGTPCADLSNSLEQLYSDFEHQEQVYNSLDHDNRKNSLNVYYKLYKLLQHQKYPVQLKDFFFLKTRDILEKHDEELRKVWAILGWEWIDTL